MSIPLSDKDRERSVVTPSTTFHILEKLSWNTYGRFLLNFTTGNRDIMNIYIVLLIYFYILYKFDHFLFLLNIKILG